jgi:hypothetical protein
MRLSQANRFLRVGKVVGGKQASLALFSQNQLPSLAFRSLIQENRRSYQNLSDDQPQYQSHQFELDLSSTESPFPRSHYCGRIPIEAGSNITTWGWIESVRPSGANLVFATLRDHTGSIQIVFHKESNTPEELVSQIPLVNDEAVLWISGTIRNRPSDKINPKQGIQGQIEVSKLQHFCFFKKIKISKSNPNLVKNGAITHRDYNFKPRYLRSVDCCNANEIIKSSN